jgi:actin-related protein 8
LEDSRRTSTSEEVAALVCGAAAEDGPSGAAEERVKKIATNLLIVGGTGGIHNIGFAVESRVAPSLHSQSSFALSSLPSAAIPFHARCSGSISRGHGGMRALRERAFYWA